VEEHKGSLDLHNFDLGANQFFLKIEKIYHKHSQREERIYFSEL